MELTAVEARVVGALIEKSFLTPDIYPMTTNALVSACNQKTNRDPVVSFDAVTIDGALLELRQRNIVRRVHTPGSRSTKHRQTLDEVLELDDGELALVSVLLLRGAQTIGELRLRTERQHGFESIEAVEQVLEALAQRATPLVQQLPRQPGQKEQRWRHLLLDDDAADPAAAIDGTGGEVKGDASSSSLAVNAPAAVDHAEVHGATNTQPALAAPTAATADGDLAARVAELESEIAILRRQLRSLATQLGEPLE